MYVICMYLNLDWLPFLGGGGGGQVKIICVIGLSTISTTLRAFRCKYIERLILSILPLILLRLSKKGAPASRCPSWYEPGYGLQQALYSQFLQPVGTLRFWPLMTWVQHWLHYRHVGNTSVASTALNGPKLTQGCPGAPGSDT